MRGNSNCRAMGGLAENARVGLRWPGPTLENSWRRPSLHQPAAGQLALATLFSHSATRPVRVCRSEALGGSCSSADQSGRLGNRCSDAPTTTL